MKFGSNYVKHILPEWSQYYIDYNGLRMQLRATVQRGEGIDGTLPTMGNRVAPF